MAGTAPFLQHASRRTRRTWALRLLAGLIVLAALSYAAIPWWLPPDWLARRLENQLCAELNRPVRIERVRVGWFEGVVFEGITVHDRPGSSEPVLARVGRLRCHLEPITTLLTGRVDHLEIDEPALYLTVDDAGRWNISDLGEREGGRLPSQSILVRGLLCRVRTPHATETIRFDRLACRLDPPSGRVRFEGEVRPQRDFGAPDASTEKEFRIHAEVSVPRLNPAVSLGGEIRFRWAGLALADLPLLLIPQVPFEQVEGTTTGTLKVRTRPDLELDFAMDVALDGVRIRWRQAPETSLVPDARVAAQGRWDPNTDVVVLGSFEYETPGIRLADRGGPDRPAMRLDLQGVPPMEAHLAGTVKDWECFSREWPRFDRFRRRARATLQGAADFVADVQHGQHEDHLVLTVDAAASACRIGPDDRPVFDAPLRTPKRLEADVTLTDRPRRRVASRLSLVLGGLSLAGSGDTAWPASFPEQPADRLRAVLHDVLPSLRADWTLACRDLAEAVALWPALGRFDALRDSRGPLDLRLTAAPAEQINRITAALSMTSATRLRFRDLFDKTEGQTLSAEIGLDWPQPTGTSLANLVATVRCGDDRLSLDTRRARVDARAVFAESSPHAGPPVRAHLDWHLPLRLTGIDRLVSLCPRIGRLFPPNGPRRLTGHADLVLTGQLADEPDDRLLRCGVEVRADDLAVRWDDWIDKPAGWAMTVSATYRQEALRGLRDESWSATLHAPAGRAEASVRRGAAVEPGGGTEHARFRADLTDVGAWVAISPRARSRAAPYELSGPLSVQVESLGAAGHQTLTLAVEATHAGFRLPARTPFVKPPGTEASLACCWRRDATPEPGDPVRWQLERGEAHLAGVHLAEVTGRVVGARAASRPAPPAAAPNWADPSAWAVRQADLEVQGGIAFDPEVANLHAGLGAWIRRAGLQGRASGRAALAARDGRISASGRIDAQAMGFSLPLDSRVAPRVHKAPGAPGGVTFEVAIDENRPNGARRLSIEEIEIDLDGNELDLAGHLDLARGPASALALKACQLDARVRVAEPAGLVRLLPDGAIRRLEGRAEADLSMSAASGAWSLNQARLSLTPIRATVDEDELTLQGRVELARNTWRFDQFHCTLGDSQGVLSGQVQSTKDTRTGRLGLVAERLDVADLMTRVGRWSRPAGATAARPGSSGARTVRALLDELRRCELELDVHTVLCKAILPGGQPLRAEAGSARVILQKGPLKATFRATVDGGLVTGEFTSHTGAAEPAYRLTYTAEAIQPGDLVDGYLRLLFPGMKATGPLTLIDETYQKLLPRAGEPNYEVGEGELIILGGSVEGRAAPLWMTRIFPGLNLARFDFSTLHSWFRKLPNGRVRHQMIYRGQYYNLYMIGESDPNRRFEYEVGLDFLADFDSRYWAESGQGRIPLFIKNGRIDGKGQFLEEEVRYVSPDRILTTLFVQNNPVITAYHAVRKRVQSER